MSGWLNKLTTTTKDGKLAPTSNGKPSSKSGSRSVTPSPSLPKITLPPTEVATPKVVLTQDDDSVSPMTVSPSSVHRINSMSASQDSLGRYSTNEGHKRYATVANDNIPVRQRVQSEIVPSRTPKGGRSRSNSQADQAPSTSVPLTESPTQSIASRRSGSIASGESTQFQSLAQLVDSPPQIGQRVSLPGAPMTALSDKERDPTGSPGKKRRTTGRQHASSVGAASATSRGKPATRHQTTMGMGLAHALVASGMGIAPPPNMLASPTGSLSPPALAKKPSNLSAANVGANDPSSPERTRIVRSRVRSASSNSRANYDSAEDSEDYDSGDALSFNDDEIPITGFAVATMKRNQDFHELFPQVPSDDYLIDGKDFSTIDTSFLHIPPRLWLRSTT
jgi:hypothetical protein